MKIDITKKLINNIVVISKSIFSIRTELKLLNNKIDSLHQKLDNINNQKEGIIRSRENYDLENYFSQIESLISIYNRLPNINFLPPTRGWAGSPDFLNKIIEIIVKNKPKFVLEVSSGVSSIIIGQALNINKEGKSLSLEHDLEYSKNSIENLNLNEINGVSRILYSPLKNYIIEGGNWKWYDIENIVFDEKIDLLIIDGPPRITQKLARFPAIPLLHNNFSDSISIILDDSNREDETIIIMEWTKYLENIGYFVKIENYNKFEKGLVVLSCKK